MIEIGITAKEAMENTQRVMKTFTKPLTELRRDKMKQKKVGFHNPKGIELRAYVLSDSLSGFPKATVVIGRKKLIQEGEPRYLFCRGISICSNSEVYEKGFVMNEGIRLAMKEMFRAFNKQITSNPIITERSIQAIGNIHLPSGNKSEFNTTLTQREYTLFQEKCPLWIKKHFLNCYLKNRLGSKLTQLVDYSNDVKNSIIGRYQEYDVVSKEDFESEGKVNLKA